MICSLKLSAPDGLWKPLGSPREGNQHAFATSSLSWFSFHPRGFFKSFFWRCCSLQNGTSNSIGLDSKWTGTLWSVWLLLLCGRWKAWLRNLRLLFLASSKARNLSINRDLCCEKVFSWLPIHTFILRKPQKTLLLEFWVHNPSYFRQYQFVVSKVSKLNKEKIEFYLPI